MQGLWCGSEPGGLGSNPCSSAGLLGDLGHVPSVLGFLTLNGPEFYTSLSGGLIMNDLTIFGKVVRTVTNIISPFLMLLLGSTTLRDV